MRYYVYALIDPTNNRPFYIGKGMDHRLQSHFTTSHLQSVSQEGSEIVGCDTKSIMKDAQELEEGNDTMHPKTKKIQELEAQGFNHTHIARIIARRLSESEALTVESCLIHSVYGLCNLTNLVSGSHSERFRAYDHWNRIEGFDLDVEANQNLNEAPDLKNKYYVYVLRHPESGVIFYVGKGRGNRLKDHFEHAMRAASKKDNKRLQEIKKCIALGHNPSDIARIIARVSLEAHAFTLEALWIKFVLGLETLKNIQPGHHSGLFRAKGDWDKRQGFDLPFVLYPGMQQDRSEKLDLMLGEALDIPLLAVQEGLPEVQFDSPKIQDSGELAIDGAVGNLYGQAGTRLKILIRRERIQMTFRWRKQAHRQWIKEHFTRLGAYPLRRRDDVFFPDCWKGVKNMTTEIPEAIRRAKLMIELSEAQSRSDLSDEALQLLEGLPKRM